jgi:hypothetical protein
MDWREDFDYDLLDAEALQFLVDYHLDGSAKGVTARVITHGLEGLSEKQLWVFKNEVVDKWLNRKCKRCNHTEGSLLIGIWENGGYCGYCASSMAE